MKGKVRIRYEQVVSPYADRWKAILSYYPNWALLLRPELRFKREICAVEESQGLARAKVISIFKLLKDDEDLEIRGENENL